MTAANQRRDEHLRHQPDPQRLSDRIAERLGRWDSGRILLYDLRGVVGAMNYAPTHLDLFSGIGGFALAAQWAGFKTIAFVEREPFCQKVLAKHWPDVPIYSDICQFGGRSLRPVSLLTGGFPCQPFSVAGEQRGKEDDRYLWPEMLRVIQATNPDWIIGENVAGLDGLGLDDCISDLEANGYEVAPPFEIPACAVDARHVRNRIWILANSHSFSRRASEAGGVESNAATSPSTSEQSVIMANSLCEQAGRVNPRGFLNESARSGETLANTNGTQCEGNERTIGIPAEYANPGIGSGWAIEPGLGRVAHGIPNRTHRLKGLGNAIVPQVAYQITKAIFAEIQKHSKNTAKL